MKAAERRFTYTDRTGETCSLANDLGKRDYRDNAPSPTWTAESLSAFAAQCGRKVALERALAAMLEAGEDAEARSVVFLCTGGAWSLRTDAQ